MSSNVIPFQSVHATRELDNQADSRLDSYLENSLTDTNETSSSSYQEGWIISYIDVLTLLLTLFVILLAMSHFKPEKSTSPETGDQVSTTNQADLIVAKTVINSIQLATPLGNTTESIAVKISDAELSELESQQKTNTPVVDNPAANNEFNSTQSDQYLDIASLQTSSVQIDMSRILPVNMPPVSRADDALTSEPDTAIDNAEQPAAGNMNELSQHSSLLNQIEQSQLADQLEINEVQNRVNLTISDQILFTPASVDLKPEGLDLLKQLAIMLKETQGVISVEGHTDNVPINNPAYPSNWELSTARATMVTRFLINQDIAAQRIRAIGYADTHPRANNTTAEGREHNRRVSIVLSLPE